MFPSPFQESDGWTIGRYTTGTDGTVTVPGLTSNVTYVVSETKAPTGYVLDETLISHSSS